MALLATLLACGKEPSTDSPAPVDDTATPGVDTGTGDTASKVAAARWSGVRTSADAHRIVGEGEGDLAGEGLAGAGDLNGDGFGDVVVGGFAYPGDGSGRGAVWVLYGPLDGVDTLAAAGALVVGDDGLGAGDTLLGVGDVDADGIDDFLMGAPVAGDAQGGEVYLFRGPLEGELTVADAAGILRGTQGGEHVGRSLARLGDLDGDGVDEVAMGANGGRHDGGNDVGTVYVHGAERLVGEVEASSGAEIDGVDDGGYFGTTLASAGDLDGDGLDDLAACAYRADEGGEDYGVVYLFAAPFSGLISAADADARLVGETVHTGRGLAGLGDVDGDGHPDLAVGAPHASFGESGSGSAYWARGPFSGARSLSEADGRIDGTDPNGGLGESVLGPGDLDGDGKPELLVGAPTHLEDRVARAGAVYLFYEAPRGTVDADAADARFAGDSEGLGLGRNLAVAGDTDADGLPELLFGTQASEQESVAGGVWLVRSGP